jgi:hypothetical protein
MTDVGLIGSSSPGGGAAPLVLTSCGCSSRAGHFRAPIARVRGRVPGFLMIGCGYHLQIRAHCVNIACLLLMLKCCSRRRDCEKQAAHSGGASPDSHMFEIEFLQIFVDKLRPVKLKD